MNSFRYGNLRRVQPTLCHLIDFIAVQHQVGCESVMLVKKDVLILNGQKLVQGIRLSENKKVLCDCHLTVAQALAFSEPARVVFLIKDPSNLVDEYGNRPDHQGFFQYLNSATDIEKAKQTVNITLYELNVNRIEEIKSSSFFWIERTVDSTVESTLTCVEKHLGLI